MSDALTVFSQSPLRDALQDMRELLSQRRLSFLLGAGCSHKAGLPLMRGLTDQVLRHPHISEVTKAILDKVIELFTGAPNATIEDYMSEIVDLLSIAERRKQTGATQSMIALGDQRHTAHGLKCALTEIKHAIASCIRDTEVDLTYHRQFVRAIHGSLQAGKAPRTVDYFVLNYDTLIEDALGLERVPYVDGFRGGATGWWDPGTFAADSVASRVFKLHGSVDWCLLEEDPLPRRVRRGIKTTVAPTDVLIYPAATKYQETQRDPFAQILLQLRQSLCPSQHMETVLAICGYNFGDSHIDLEIKNALHQSEGCLTVVAFVGENEPQGELGRWAEDPVVSEQVRVYAKRGFFHKETVVPSSDDPGWWQFETLSRLLGGER